MSSGEVSTATEICKIIKACEQFGVDSLEFKGLKLSFSPKKVAKSDTKPVLLEEVKEIGDNNKELEYDDRLEEAALDVEEMKLIDPLGYEALVHNEGLNA